LVIGEGIDYFRNPVGSLRVTLDGVSDVLFGTTRVFRCPLFSHEATTLFFVLLAVLVPAGRELLIGELFVLTFVARNATLNRAHLVGRGVDDVVDLVDALAGNRNQLEELSIPVDRGVSGDLRSGVLTAV